MSSKWQGEQALTLKAAQLAAERPPKPKKDRFLLWMMVLGGLFFIFSVYQLKLNLFVVFEGALTFLQLLTEMFPPSFAQWKHVLPAALESLQVAIIGTAVAILLAFPTSFLAAENLTPHSSISYAIKAFASLLRAIPTLVWALVFIVAVGMGPLPGTLAISVHAYGMLVKMFAQSIEEMDEGVLEAMRATGAGWLQIILQGVLPTVFSAFLAWSIYRLEIDIGESTILGVVGAGGIGWELVHAMRMYRFDEAFFVALVIFAMVYSVEMLSNRMKLRMKNR